MQKTCEIVLVVQMPMTPCAHTHVEHLCWPGDVVVAGIGKPRLVLPIAAVSVDDVSQVRRCDAHDAVVSNGCSQIDQAPPCEISIEVFDEVFAVGELHTADRRRKTASKIEAYIHGSRSRAIDVEPPFESGCAAADVQASIRDGPQQEGVPCTVNAIERQCPRPHDSRRLDEVAKGTSIEGHRHRGTAHAISSLSSTSWISTPVRGYLNARSEAHESDATTGQERRAAEDCGRRGCEQMPAEDGRRRESDGEQKVQ